jgi:hypothetical protein
MHGVQVPDGFGDKEISDLHRHVWAAVAAVGLNLEVSVSGEVSQLLGKAFHSNIELAHYKFGCWEPFRVTVVGSAFIVRLSMWV